MSDAQTRINARIDSELAERLDEVRRLSGKTTSTILKEALEQYLAHASGQVRTPYEIAAGAGAIGCADSGHSDTSEHYKTILADAIRQKHDSR